MDQALEGAPVTGPRLAAPLERRDTLAADLELEGGQLLAAIHRRREACTDRQLVHVDVARELDAGLLRGRRRQTEIGEDPAEGLAAAQRALVQASGLRRGEARAVRGLGLVRRRARRAERSRGRGAGAHAGRLDAIVDAIGGEP